MDISRLFASSSNISRSNTGLTEGENIVRISSTSEGLKLDLKTIDEIIVDKSPAWLKIAKSYKQGETIKININDTIINLPAIIILKYLRSMSMAIIEICQEIFRAEHKLEAGELFVDSFGSTEITSDYDIAFYGKGASKLLKYIYTSFEMSFPSKTLPLSFDTNGYLAPQFILYPDGHRFSRKIPFPEWFTSNIFIIKEYGKSEGSSGRGIIKCILVPRSSVAISVESRIALDKIMKVFKDIDDGSKIEDDTTKKEYYDEKYKIAIELGQELEDFYYNDDKTELEDERTYWVKLGAVSQNSIESYHTVSTVMAVVIGLQQKNENIKRVLKEENWVIAALENISDLIEHGGVSSVTEDEKQIFKPNTDKIYLIHTSKYVMRILECLKNTGLLSDKSETEIEDIIMNTKNMVSLRGKHINFELQENQDIVTKYITIVMPYIIEKIYIIIRKVNEYITSYTESAGNRKRRLTRKITKQIKSQSQSQKRWRSGMPSQFQSQR